MNKFSVFMGAMWPLVLPALAGASFLLGQEVNKVVIAEPTEQDAAMILHGPDARYVGILCANSNTTVIRSDFSGFPDGCMEIRRLDNERRLD